MLLTIFHVVMLLTIFHVIILLTIFHVVMQGHSATGHGTESCVGLGHREGSWPSKAVQPTSTGFSHLVIKAKL